MAHATEFVDIPEGISGPRRDDTTASGGSKWKIFYDDIDYTYTYDQMQEEGLAPPNLTWSELVHGAAQWEENLWFQQNPAPSGGGRGSSRAVYVRPDDNLVRGAIEGAWDGLTGTVPAAEVTRAIDLFYTKDRANYDNPGQQIDAMAAVLEVIRGTAKYKEMHQLRSESQDEGQWIRSKVSRLQQAGVSTPLAQELGEAQAQAGSGSDTVVQAGEIATLTQTGRALDSHKARMRQTMGASLGLL